MFSEKLTSLLTSLQGFVTVNVMLVLITLIGLNKLVSLAAQDAVGYTVFRLF